MKKWYLLLLTLGGLNSLCAQWTGYVPGASDTVGISDVHVVNDNVIWSVGVRYSADDSFYGFFENSEVYFMLTTNGGTSWTTGTVPMGDAPFVANMTAVDANTAFVCGLTGFGNAKCLKTVNGGTTWTEDFSPPYDPVVSWPDYIHAFAPAKMCAVGDPRDGEFEIYTTANAGVLWQPVSGANIPDPVGGEFGYNNLGDAYGNTLWFGTSAGRIYKSTDACLNWTVYDTPISDVGGVSFADENHGIIGSIPVYDSDHPQSELYHTSNGGATWTPLALPDGGSFRLLGAEYINDASVILMTLTQNSILTGEFQTWISTHRGDGWQQIGSGQNVNWPTFLDGDTGWAGEAQQFDHATHMWEYTGSPLVGLWQPTELNAEILLSPNPAVDQCRITIQSDLTGNALLLINDVQGRLVRSLNITLNGNHSETIDLGNVPGGQYSVTLSTADGKASRSLVVQK